MSEEEVLSENVMGNFLSSDKKSISSPLPGDKGIEEKEEIPNEEESGNGSESEIDIECTECSNEQQLREPCDKPKSPELQYDGCRSSDGSGDGNTGSSSESEQSTDSNEKLYESNELEQQYQSQFREFIRRQNELWDKYHRQEQQKREGKLTDEDFCYIIEEYVIPKNVCKKCDKKRNKRKNRKQKRWYKKKQKKYYFPDIYVYY